jgi:Phosphoglucose isomerase
MTTYDSHSLAQRLVAKDVTLWPSPNVAPTRLGWVDVATRLRPEVDALMAWAASVTAKHIVLIGMGGSSLGPEVLRAAVGSTRLTVLDTTDAATVAAVPLDDTLFIVSSKSGGTLEVRSLLAHVWTAVPDPSRFVAITDPGTELEGIARERGFAKVFVNDPDIGGRYSVLSYFGLVPAALLGYDVHALIDGAESVDVTAAVALGLSIGEASKAGQDKLTVRVPAAFAELGLWIEQLVAESTGKQGVGVVPVPTQDDEPGSDRVHITVDLHHPVELGAEFYRWEVMTAAMGMALSIDPFNEPNVAESKANTARVLGALPLPALPTTPTDEVLTWLRSAVKPGDYVCLQAYLPYGSEAALGALRTRLRDALNGVAVTAGYGPRFLHSTGQLHKGGANNIVSVQFVPSNQQPLVDVPGFGYDFGTLIGAQSIGDFESLRQHDRRVIRVAVNTVDHDPFAEIA